MILKYCFFFTALFFFNITQAQWNKVNSVPNQDIVALDYAGSTLLAATDSNLIYKSTDMGLTWKPIEVSPFSIQITALKVIDNIIYIGTYSHGIFTSSDNGKTWFNPVFNILTVTSFEKYSNKIYAGTQGNGVLVFDSVANIWIAVNNALPNYSHSVNTILANKSKLFIGAGANGTFYQFNNVQASWEEFFYYGRLMPGIQIDKLIAKGDTIFGIGGRRVIRSNNNGIDWIDDNEGVQVGVDKKIFVGADKIFLLTNTLNGDTWIQQRAKEAVNKSTWAMEEEIVPNGYSYDIMEYDGKLFLARENGLFVKTKSVGVSFPTHDKVSVAIFPNPTSQSVLHIRSNEPIAKLSIVNSVGQAVYNETTMQNESIVLPSLNKGIYILSFKLLNGQSEMKKLIIE